MPGERLGFVSMFIFLAAFLTISLVNIAFLTDLRYYPILFALFQLLFFLFVSVFLLLLSVFLSSILTPHTSVLSTVAAHDCHQFNLPYTSSLFPLSLFTVAIPVSMIFPLMCQIP